MKILSIEPPPSELEAAAIGAALAKLSAIRNARPARSRYGRRASGRDVVFPRGRDVVFRASEASSECHLSWREAARREALDAGF